VREERAHLFQNLDHHLNVSLTLAPSKHHNLRNEPHRHVLATDLQANRGPEDPAAPQLIILQVLVAVERAASEIRPHQKSESGKVDRLRAHVINLKEGAACLYIRLNCSPHTLLYQRDCQGECDEPAPCSAVSSSHDSCLHVPPGCKSHATAT